MFLAIILIAVALVALASLYVLRGDTWLRHWGAGRGEISSPLPGDELVPQALGTSTRAIDIDAPIDAVFPWLVQMGQGRGGFYSYDALENVLGVDVHSADHIVPEWQALHRGDVTALSPVGSRPMRVMSCEEGRHIVLRTTDLRSGGPISAGNFFREEIDGTWLFFVRPLGPRRTRLVVRWRAAWRPSLPASLVYRFVYEPIHFLMERKMLLGIRQRAEALPGTTPSVVYFPLVPPRGATLVPWM
ncbi:MAG TPA: hypothetical protein VH877_23010 [Polyangia bacterium]|jgi:hypothetical protein|nr:hypothetical protein [Polyangia bacterium]